MPSFDSFPGSLTPGLTSTCDPECFRCRLWSQLISTCLNTGSITVSWYWLVISIWASTLIIMIINGCDTSIYKCGASQFRQLTPRSDLWGTTLEMSFVSARCAVESRLHLHASFLPSKLLGQLHHTCFCLSSALLANTLLYSTCERKAQTSA